MYAKHGNTGEVWGHAPREATINIEFEIIFMALPYSITKPHVYYYIAISQSHLWLKGQCIGIEAM